MRTLQQIAGSLGLTMFWLTPFLVIAYFLGWLPPPPQLWDAFLAHATANGEDISLASRLRPVYTMMTVAIIVVSGLLASLYVRRWYIGWPDAGPTLFVATGICWLGLVALWAF